MIIQIDIKIDINQVVQVVDTIKMTNYLANDVSE